MGEIRNALKSLKQRNNPLSDDELDMLAQMLEECAQGRFPKAKATESPLVFAVSKALQKLSEKVVSVRDSQIQTLSEIEALAEKAALSQSEKEAPVRTIYALPKELEEARNLTQRLSELSEYVTAASLNVHIEIKRDDRINKETLAGFSDEIRRFADRLRSTTDRFPKVFSEIEESLKKEAQSFSVQTATQRQLLLGTIEDMGLKSAEFPQAFEKEFDLPDVSQIRRILTRIESLKKDLKKKLSRDSSLSRGSFDQLENIFEDLEDLLRTPGIRTSGDSR